MLAIVRWMAMEAPLPISIIVITAATPMTMPSMVSIVRMTLRRSAPKAVFKMPYDFMRPSVGRTRAVLDEAVHDMDDALGMPCHAGIMGHEDDGEAVGAVELLEHPEEFLAGARIKVAGRLVGQEHPRMVDQRPGDRHPLLLAAGKLRRLVVGRSAKPTFSSNSAARCFILLLTEVFLGIGQRHQDVLQRRSARQQVEGLKHKTDHSISQPGLFLGGQPGDILAIQPVIAGVG